jgi:hypothetical protein
VDTAWSSVVDPRAEEGRPGLRRAGEITRVVLVASLRIALAVATSYIAAEMALFLVFQPEVNARTADLLRQSQVQRVAAIHAEFDAKRAARTTDRNELTGSSDPDIIRLTQQTADLDKQVESATRDLGILQAAAAAELDGDRYQGTLSDGTVVTTTGRRGDGAAARSLAQRRDTQQRLAGDLTTRRDRARADLDARRAAVKTTNQPALTTLDERENSDAADEKAALAAAVGDPSAINGLLLRQAALDKLTHDLHPETLADDPVPPCTGLFAWVCHLRNAIVPPTPMGPAIVAYRVIFFVIEILPITYKVITSLRRRRPYDVAKAALEEASNVDMVRLLDRQLHDASREVSTRSDQRYAARPSANGSDARPWSNSPQGRL